MREEDDTYFAFSASLRIFGDIPNLEEITSLLGVEPTYRHQKGYRRSPRSQPMPHDMWIFEVPVEEALVASGAVVAIAGVARLPAHRADAVVAAAAGAVAQAGLVLATGAALVGDRAGAAAVGRLRALEAPLNVSVIIT